MQEPTLVILAAGMGSRFGGLKQITAVDDQGHAIIDFSLYDAYRAGFRKVAFIIKKAIEEDFKAAVGRRMEKYFEVKYIYQELDCLPEGFAIPEGRVKPWGTGHAVLCCRGQVDGPFAVINADDFYGPSAYASLYEFLSGRHEANEHAMVAYLLKNTVTENGSVARGVCQVEDGLLRDVVETLGIVKDGENAAFPDGEGRMQPLSGEAPVSMNCWGFSPSMLEELAVRFPRFLEENLPKNPLKCEYFLPTVANQLIQEGLARVRILNCHESWHGITYKEDMPSVIDAIAGLRQKGIYPQTLLD